MKKRLIFLVVCLLAMSVSLAQALPTYVLTLGPNQSGQGGPFTVVGNGYNFNTFCVETGEEFSYGATYYGSIDNVAYYGSNVIAYPNGEALNKNTISLYEYYLSNASTLSQLQDAQIQYAIWGFQGQDPTGLSNPYGIVIASDPYYLSPGSYTGAPRNIAVLNLWTSDVGNAPGGGPYEGFAAQSQLMPVPEPLSLLLLGLGLIGVAGIRRKFKG